MTERPIKELLIIMRDNIELFEKHHCYGLCDLVFQIYRRGEITTSKAEAMKDYIKETMPLRFNCLGNKSVFGWPMRELQPRLEWLNEQINLL